MTMSTTALAVRILLTFLALNARYADAESIVCEGFEHCEYNGDMCAINPDSCVREMLMERRCVDECKLVYDASGKVYTPRDPIEYRLELDEEILKEDFYAETLTYSIVKGNRNWSIPDSFKPVDGCCSLKLNETCILPPRDHVDDRYYAILPRSENQEDDYYYYDDDVEKNAFCLYSIQEQAVSYEFCEIKEEPGCLELVNGIPQRRPAFIPLNSGVRQTLDEDTPKCIFAAPKHFINYTNEKSSFLAKGVKYSEFGGENYVFFPNGKNLTCDVRENLPGNVSPQVELEFDEQGEYYCKLYLDEDKKKGFTPWCTDYNTGEGEDEEDRSTVIAAVISCIIIAFVIIILVICAFRKHFKELTYKKSVKDIPDPLKVDNLEDMLLVDENSNQPQKEKPESIDMVWHSEWKDNEEKGLTPQNRIDSGFEEENEEAADQITRDNEPIVEYNPEMREKLHPDSGIGKANEATPTGDKSDVEISSLPDSGIGSANESRHGSTDTEHKYNSDFSVVFQPASDGSHKDRVLAANELDSTSVPSYVAHNGHEFDSDIPDYNFMVDSQHANDGYTDKNLVLAIHESEVTSAPNYVAHDHGQDDSNIPENNFMVDSQRVNDGYVDKNRVLVANEFEANAVPSYAAQIRHQDYPEMIETDYPAPGDYLRHH